MRKGIDIFNGVSLVIIGTSIVTNAYSIKVITIVYIALFVGWQWIENKLDKQVCQTKKSFDYPPGAGGMMIGFSIVLFVTALHCMYREVIIHFEWIGLFCVAIGLASRIWAFHSIGVEYIKPPTRDQHYVNKGPYLFIRHPSNYGLLLIGIGTAICFSSVTAFILNFILLLPAVLFTNRVEEVSRKFQESIKSDSIQTFSHEAQDYIPLLLLYEKLIHPVFLVVFTRRFFTFSAIFHSLRKMRPFASGNNNQSYRVLDMACGTGWFGRKVLTENGESNKNLFVHGIDISSNSILFAQELYEKNKIDVSRYQLRCDSVFDMNCYDKDHFDEIWFCGSLHQVTDPLKALLEASRVLKVGGTVYCQTFVKSKRPLIKKFQEKSEANSGHTFFDYDDLVQMIDRCKFTLIDTVQSGAVLLFCAEKK